MSTAKHRKEKPVKLRYSEKEIAKKMARMPEGYVPYNPPKKQPKSMSHRKFVKQYSKENPGWKPSHRSPLHTVMSFFYFLPLAVTFAFTSAAWALLPVYAVVTYPFRLLKK